MNDDMARKIRDIINPKPDIFGAPVEPLPNPVNGDKMLTHMYKTVKKHVSCDDEVAVTAALWSTFTWVVDYVDCAPIGIITAPERQCGKTQTLTVLSNLSRRPIQGSNLSSASIYRVIDQSTPTLLIDEADTFLRNNRHLIGILNSGHMRSGAQVFRTDSKGRINAFSTWGAKAISGIGNMPETIMDRGIIMPIRRMLPEEKVSPLHESEKFFTKLRSALARWSMDNGPRIPDVPRTHIPELNFRQNDNWRPLLAIAELAGGDWPFYAQCAAKKFADYSISNCTTNSRDLLSDIYDIFQATGVDRISTVHLIESLCTCKPRLWGKFNKGAPITPEQLSENLTHFHITHGSIRLSSGKSLKGYYLKRFQDAFRRYILRDNTEE